MNNKPTVAVILFSLLIAIVIGYNINEKRYVLGASQVSRVKKSVTYAKDIPLKDYIKNSVMNGEIPRVPVGKEYQLDDLGQAYAELYNEFGTPDFFNIPIEQRDGYAGYNALRKEARKRGLDVKPIQYE